MSAPPRAAARQLRELRLSLAAPALLLLIGTLGYRLVEGWSWFDALYMTVITLATIGFGEVHPLTPEGRLFTIVLTLVGVFTLLYAATAVIRAVATGELAEVFGRQRMRQRLAELVNHVIVCGYGRMGRLVCQELAALKVPFVVIDKDESRVRELDYPHGLPLAGDASTDEILAQAGIARARALVAVVSSDADNLYITMSARLLNERINIVARAEDERSEPKFLRAGATRVVSPYVIGGHRVAHAVIRPTVVDFMELATASTYLELQLEETLIAPGSELAGQALGATQLLGDRNLIVVALKRAAGEMLFNPQPDEKIAAGDTLISLGNREALERLVRRASSKS